MAIHLIFGDQAAGKSTYTPYPVRLEHVLKKNY